MGPLTTKYSRPSPSTPRRTSHPFHGVDHNMWARPNMQRQGFLGAVWGRGQTGTCKSRDLAAAEHAHTRGRRGRDQRNQGLRPYPLFQLFLSLHGVLLAHRTPKRHPLSTQTPTLCSRATLSSSGRKMQAQMCGILVFALYPVTCSSTGVLWVCRKTWAPLTPDFKSLLLATLFPSQSFCQAPSP